MSVKIRLAAGLADLEERHPRMPHLSAFKRIDI
jgi:hypothetical protein